MADDVEPRLPGSYISSVHVENQELPETIFLDLPPEVIRCVLVLPSLTMVDVSRLAQTCHKLNALVSDDCNDVWRGKHRQRWPEANKIVLDVSPELDWHAECKRAVGLFQVTANLMERVWPKVYMESEVCYSHFTPFRQIMKEDKPAYFYIKDFLMNVIKDENICANLTQRYQAQRVLRFLRQEYLTGLWRKLKALPEEQQLLEVGVGYVSQWCQPLSDITTECLGKHFDKLASYVLKYLAVSNPDHPIFTTPEDERRKWATKNLTSDRWGYNHCMEILHAMDYVLIERIGFHGTKENYHHRENYLINEVLDIQRGVPITLNVITECVARRLGIRTEPWYRGHFVLRWISDKSPHCGEFFLDSFNSGSLIRPAKYMGNSGGSGCPYRDLHCPQGPATCMEIVERLTAGIEVAGRMSMRSNGHSTHLRSALELMFVINPRNLNYILHLARLYMLYNISVSDLIDSIMSTMEELPSDVHKHAENILQMFKVYCPDAESKPLPAPQTREVASHVQFAVGMSMYHKQYNYLCVIFGWDPKCNATETWKQEMRVQGLKHKDNQPFYNVLVPDGTTRYAAQENLEPLKENNKLNYFNIHPDVGRYFDSYHNGYYVPNAVKRAEYPDDLDVCQQFYVGEESS